MAPKLWNCIAYMQSVFLRMACVSRDGRLKYIYRDIGGFRAFTCVDVCVCVRKREKGEKEMNIYIGMLRRKMYYVCLYMHVYENILIPGF